MECGFAVRTPTSFDFSNGPEHQEEERPTGLVENCEVKLPTVLTSATSPDRSSDTASFETASQGSIGALDAEGEAEALGAERFEQVKRGFGCYALSDSGPEVADSLAEDQAPLDSGDRVYGLEEDRMLLYYELCHQLTNAARTPWTVELGDYFNCLGDKANLPEDRCYNIEQVLDLTKPENEAHASKPLSELLGMVARKKTHCWITP